MTENAGNTLYTELQAASRHLYNSAVPQRVIDFIRSDLQPILQRLGSDISPSASLMTQAKMARDILVAEFDLIEISKPDTREDYLARTGESGHGRLSSARTRLQALSALQKQNTERFNNSALLKHLKVVLEDTVNAFEAPTVSSFKNMLRPE